MAVSVGAGGEQHEALRRMRQNRVGEIQRTEQVNLPRLILIALC
jgi:hypothetical protein